MEKYYIYAHSRKDTGVVFYVGKGSGERVNTTGNRSVFWKRIVKKHGYKKHILESRLTEIEAYEKEILWINHFKSIGQCEANFTMGGDGVKVEKRWWGGKISESMKGKNAGTGINSSSFKDVLSKEDLTQLYSIRKLSSVEIGKMFGVSYTTVLERIKSYGIKKRNAGKKAVPICCTTDGITFDSINDAAKHYNLFRENIRKVLNGKYNHTGGKKFRYVADNREVSISSIKSAGDVEWGGKRQQK